MQRVGIVGAGLVGRSWAMIFARAGWEARLFDPAPAVAQGALALCRDGLLDLAAQGLCEAPEAAAARITVQATLAEAVSGASLVQENGPERLEAKRAIFAELDRLVPPGTPLASSTSALPCSAWSGELAGRGRCLVGHPVNPPHLLPLVELCGAPWTEPAVLDRARDAYAAIGQSPVVLRREIGGFVLNRLQAALLAEAFRLVEEGVVSPADLDRTVTQGLGLRWAFMGPFETIELNAAGGIPAYVHHFRDFLELIPRDPAGPEVFGPARVAEVMAQWAPARDGTAKMQWRDRRLAALRVHLAAQPCHAEGADAGSAPTRDEGEDP